METSPVIPFFSKENLKRTLLILRVRLLAMYLPRKIRKDACERTQCPVCKGARVVKVIDETAQPKEIPCPRCGGKGFI